MALSLDDIRSRSNVEAIQNMYDPPLRNLLDRAVSFLRGLTKRDFTNETDATVIADYDLMTVYAIEYLYFHSLPDVKEDGYLGITSERIGTYSYTAEPGQAVTTGKTGNPEFDALLSLYSYRTSGIGGIFSVGGPSSRGRRRL